VVGAAVVLAVRGDWRSPFWVVAVPALLYAAWYLKYGHQASETQLSLWKTTLVYSFQALSATVAPLVGLSSVAPSTGLLDTTFGVPLAVAVVVTLAAACLRGWRPPVMFWRSAAALVFCSSRRRCRTADRIAPTGRPALPNDQRDIAVPLPLLCRADAATRGPRRDRRRRRPDDRRSDERCAVFARA